MGFCIFVHDLFLLGVAFYEHTEVEVDDGVVVRGVDDVEGVVEFRSRQDLERVLDH